MGNKQPWDRRVVVGPLAWVLGGGREAPGGPVGAVLFLSFAGTGKEVNNWSCVRTGKANRASENTASAQPAVGTCSLFVQRLFLLAGRL